MLLCVHARTEKGESMKTLYIGTYLSLSLALSSSTDVRGAYIRICIATSIRGEPALSIKVAALTYIYAYI